MILSHFSSTLFSFDDYKTYNQDPISKYPMKPKGLWLSDENSYGWKQWCEGEQWNLDAFAFENTFVVETFRNILHLKTPQELLDFTEQFVIKGEYEILRIINWQQVANLYSGLIITPYQWECRLHSELFWYYGWDCASACVWDLSVVKELC